MYLPIILPHPSPPSFPRTKQPQNCFAMGKGKSPSGGGNLAVPKSKIVGPFGHFIGTAWPKAFPAKPIPSNQCPSFFPLDGLLSDQLAPPLPFPICLYRPFPLVTTVIPLSSLGQATRPIHTPPSALRVARDSRQTIFAWLFLLALLCGPFWPIPHFPVVLKSIMNEAAAAKTSTFTVFRGLAPGECEWTKWCWE